MSSPIALESEHNKENVDLGYVTKFYVVFWVKRLQDDANYLSNG